MENTPKITIEELAVKLNGKMWTKGDLKRIYLDRGYNTKKMSTKTYVEETATGNFNVKCFVECPSQDYNWCKSQAEIVIEGVEEDINEIIELAKVKLIDARLSENETEVEVRISYNGIEETEFLTEAAFDARFNQYPQSVFDNLPETKTLVSEKKEQPDNLAVTSSFFTRKNWERDYKAENFVSQGTLNQKVSHPRFGLGEIIEEYENDGMKKFKILFETEGEKLLLERFANLTYL